MKNALQVGDWCKLSEMESPIWIRSLSVDRIEGYFATDIGSCYSVYFKQSDAKPCLKKDVEAYIKKQLAVKGETEFKRKYAQKTFFVPYDTRLQSLKDLKKGANADLLTEINAVIRVMEKSKP